MAYRLCAKEVSDNSPCHTYVVVEGTKRRLPIAGLKPYTWYTVGVEAGTTGGYGPQTQFNHRTGEWGKCTVSYKPLKALLHAELFLAALVLTTARAVGILCVREYYPLISTVILI